MTGPGGGPVADDTPSLITSILDAVKGLANGSVEDVAKVLGIWASAKAAISTVASGIAAAASQAVINTANAKYQGVPLSPAVLATGIVRNVWADSTGAAGTPPSGYPAALFTGVAGHSPTDEAALSGLSGDRFAGLVGSTGMSYGIVDALRLLNRAKGTWAMAPNPAFPPTFPVYVDGTDLGAAWGISSSEFAEVVAHSDIRPEYIPDLLKLARNTISPADAVEMVVKQIVSAEVGADLYAAAGGFPEQFGALVAAAGDAAGIEKSVELRMQGIITAAQLERIVGMSRMNPDFYYLTKPDSTGVIPLGRKWLGAYEIGEAVKAGTVDMATATSWLEAEGYDSAQVVGFISAVAGTSTNGVKQETEAQVLSQYESGYLTKADATKALTSLHYTPAAITALLTSTEAKARLSAHNAAVTRVKNAYLVGGIDKAQASTDLTTLGVSQDTITILLTDWDVEIATPSRHLSEAMVGKFLREGVLSAAQATAKWVAMGYSAADAALLAGEYAPPPPTEPGAGSPAVTAQ